jgi:hypothetical protein
MTSSVVRVLASYYRRLLCKAPAHFTQIRVRNADQYILSEIGLSMGLEVDNQGQ